MKKIVIGLTGGIASGKSVVSAYLEKKPFVTVIDADVISREVFFQPATAQKIAAAFPECVSDGVPDRKLLRSVFSDENKTKTLNGIMHPAIIETCEKRIEEASGRIVVLVVPLLFETGMDKLCDLTITVVCDRKVRIKRLTERDNIDEAMADNMINRQMSDSERIEKADYVLTNDGKREDLEAKADKILTEIIGDKR